MFNSKYSKFLTVILVIAIFVIIGILVFIGINWYKAYSTNADAENDGLGTFDNYINNVQTENKEENTQTNTVGNETLVDPDINTNEIVQNVDTNNNASTGNSSNTAKKPTYKGYNMVGKIEIPKINVKYPVLEEVTPSSIEVSVAVLCGAGINQVGNTVIIGHNYRNGTFFSNNKKLAIGDKIYLTDLEGNKVAYTIYRKYNTGANDADYMVRDTDGKREISLSTCTDDSKQRLIIWAKED